MENDQLVRVYTVQDANQAELLRNALHAEGIACEIDGEGQAGFSGVFDIGLLVRAWDLDKARKVIESHNPI